MKKQCITLLFAAIMIIVASCGTPVYVEGSKANISQYKTYQWVETSANEKDNRDMSAFGDQAIHAAVEHELSKKGFREVTENPDFLVTHDVLVKRTAEQQYDPRYTQPFTRVYFNPYLRRWGTIYYPSQFIGYDTYTVPVSEGTVTLTIMDARTDKAVWQGWTTEEMSSRRFTSDELRKTTIKIIKKLK